MDRIRDPVISKALLLLPRAVAFVYKHVVSLFRSADLNSVFHASFLSHSVRTPTPNIQPNLKTLGDRQSSMICLLVALSIRSHIHPEHGIPLDRLKLHAHLAQSLVRLSTFQEMTPPSLPRAWHAHARELGTSTAALGIDIHHKGADPVHTTTPAHPVEVVLVLAALHVLLGA